jgi:electron transport complex protein RnfC
LSPFFILIQQSRTHHRSFQGVLLFGTHSFAGGIHLPSIAESALPHAIETLPPPDQVVIPLLHHSGAAAHAVVKRGDHVMEGQVIGEADAPGAAFIHASLSGAVASVASSPHPSGANVLSVTINRDGDRTAEALPTRPWRELAPEEIIRIIENAGIIGNHGDLTHQILARTAGKEVDTVIINGVECEPGLAAARRLLIEKTEDVLHGALITRKVCGAHRLIIAIGKEKRSKAAAAVAGLLANEAFKEISLAQVAARYPAGEPTLVIKAVTGRTIPSRGAPIDARCVVIDVATALAIRNALCDGLPVTRRLITVSGPCIAKPANLLVRVGTPVRLLLEHCQADMSRAKRLVAGGMMSGLCLHSPDVPCIKTWSALQCTDAVFPDVRMRPCINCGHCVKVCPARLVPSMIARYAEKGDYHAAAEWNSGNCMECGCCAWVCPSKINLLHFMKLARSMAVRKTAAETGARP